jgi:hypothetical protein
MSAADALTGRNVWLGIGKQAAFGTAIAPTKFFEVTDIGGLMPEYDWKKSDRRVGTRFKALGSKSNKKIPISFTVEANAENLPLLLMLGMGANTVAADGAAYKHSFTLAENLPYFTAWVQTDSVADNVSDDTVHQIVNCKVVSMKIDAVIDDVIKVAIEAIGTDRNYCYKSKADITATVTNLDATVLIASTAGLVVGASVSGTGVPVGATIASIVEDTSFELSEAATGDGTAVTIAAPTPTFPTSRSLGVKAEEGQSKLELGANTGALAQFDEAQEFHITITNGVVADMRIDNTTTAAALREGDSEITGNAKVVYNRNSYVEIEAFQAGSARAIRFTATSEEEAATGKPYLMVITFDSARYSGAPTSWDPDVISADLQFEVAKTTSYPLIEITNATSGTY